MRAQLTERERAIAVALALGVGNGELARRLQLSPRGVQYAMVAVYRKLCIDERHQLVAALLRDGYLTLADLLDLLPSAAPLVRAAAAPADPSTEVRFEQPTYISYSGLRPSTL